MGRTILETMFNSAEPPQKSRRYSAQWECQESIDNALQFNVEVANPPKPGPQSMALCGTACAQSLAIALC